MKITSVSYVFVMTLFITISSCSTVPKSPFPELQTVAFVDMDRYLGKWYEIARYPHSFEEGCYGATAFYKKKKDGTIQVINQCRLGSMQGKLKEAIGEASVGDIKTNSKLKVQFFWPFKGDYWIIHLDKDYQIAIVSEPNRQYLWILSRSPHLDPEILKTLKLKLIDLGFNLDHLIITPQ